MLFSVFGQNRRLRPCLCGFRGGDHPATPPRLGGDLRATSRSPGATSFRRSPGGPRRSGPAATASRRPRPGRRIAARTRSSGRGRRGAPADTPGPPDVPRCFFSTVSPHWAHARTSRRLKRKSARSIFSRRIRARRLSISSSRRRVCGGSSSSERPSTSCTRRLAIAMSSRVTSM